MAEKRAQVSGAGALAGLAGIANLLPTSLVTSIARSQAAGMDFATSNLRSSKRHYYMSGAKVNDTYAFGPLAGTAFNITAMSYAGRFGIGLFMDPTPSTTRPACATTSRPPTASSSSSAPADDGAPAVRLLLRGARASARR